MYIKQKYETQYFIRVAVPVGDERECASKKPTSQTKKNAQTRSVLGRRPLAKVGHTDAKCT